MLSLVLLGSLAPALRAQSNTEGYLYGFGVPAGAAIMVESLDTGLKRETKADATGNFRVPALPTGRYKVTLRGPAAGGQVVDDVLVSLGTGTNVRFGSKEVIELEKVTVTAGSISPIDVSSVESVTVFSKKTIEQLPVGRSPTSVALLAPGTTQGVSAFGALASFGGSSVGENTYYVNGFNLSNHRSFLSPGVVPFEFYEQLQVKTGGYGAEFGRSTGGVINATTKRGGNQFKAGASVYYDPAGLASHSPSVFLPTGAPYSDRSRSRSEATNGNVWVSGPVVKNRLFYYGLYNYRNSWSEGSGITTFSRSKGNSPYYAGKVDWNITDDHALEITAISDKRISKSESFTYNFGTKVIGASRGITTSYGGGRDYIFRYHGKLTNDLTLSALFGKSNVDGTSRGAGDGYPYLIDARSGTALLVGNATQLSVQTLMDYRKAYRADAEYAFNLWAPQRLKFGVDREDVSTNSITKYSGDGIYWRYVVTAPGRVLANGGIVPAGVTQYARKRSYANGGLFSTREQALYAEDNIKLLNDRLLLSVGLRNELFDNKNSLGQTFVKINNQWGPRLGAAFDPAKDGRSKFFANYGRYYLPIATNTNMRLAGGENYYEEYYTLNSLNADFTPNIGAQIGGRTVFADGTIKPPRQIVDHNLKPMFQDEYIVGYQRALSKTWTAGFRGTYRNVVRFIEDMAIDETLNAYARAQGIPTSKFNAGGNDYYVLSNPGQTVTFNVDFNDGKGSRAVTFSPAELRYPLAERQYVGLELFFERVNDGKWFLQGSYTLSWSWGNDEGSVLSDIGQADPGLTQLFDHPGLMDHSYGYLANDKRHKFKLFGAYALTSQIQAGGNLRIESGTPLNSLGYHPTDAFARAYGADSFYTNGVPAPRASVGRNPWVTQIDLTVKYRPEWAKRKISIGVDVFNVLNAHKNTEKNQAGEIGLMQPNPAFGLPTVFQSPRSVRLSMTYDY
jgi:hypothetical protein